MAKKNAVIPNWTIFGTHIVALEIHQFTDEDDTVVYQLALTIFLDDSTPLETEREKQKVITIYTDKTGPNLGDLVHDAAVWAGQVFANIGDKVYVIDEEGEVSNEITLSTFLNSVESTEEKKFGNARFAN